MNRAGEKRSRFFPCLPQVRLSLSLLCVLGDIIKNQEYFLSFPFHETRHEVDDPIASDSAIYHHETEFSTVVDSRYDIETKSGSCRLDDRRLPFEPPGPPCMVVGPQIRFIS